jgi:hypothetical protein
MKHACTIVAVLVLLVPAGAAAQPNASRFEAGVQVPVDRSSEFEQADAGIGARLGWRPATAIGIEAELNVYPRRFPSPRGFSRRRVEGLFGATVGPTMGRVRPFARLRPGFLQFAKATEPVICIAIFPPPLSCVLAAGRTVFALDAGGGIEIAATPTAFIRADAGDRLVRYPRQVFNQGTTRDVGAFSHDFRFAIGAGLRF